MRAWLLACAALALALAYGTQRAAAAAHTHARPALHTQRIEHIKAQILAKLGLSTRPTAVGAPPRDVVRQILARATDPSPPAPQDETDNSMREIIAIAHREAWRLFKELSSRLIDSSGDQRAGAYLGQRMSLAIQRGEITLEQSSLHGLHYGAVQKYQRS